MTRIIATPGPADCFTDIAGLKVGHAVDEKARSGVTVVVPDTAVPMAADVRGGGPGTRETEALAPHCLVDRVHGLVLAGGSVFGLAAADGLVAALSADGIGLDLGPHAIPVVPAAVLFDLKNGGDKNWGVEPPYHHLAAKAYAGRGLCGDTEGPVGAGIGAVAGDQPGGLATASLVTKDGLMVSAMVAVNSFGIVADASAVRPGDLHLPKAGLIAGNTTIGVVATNLTLDKAGCLRLAVMAQDGLARAIRPIHTPFDGDTLFALSTECLAPDQPVAASLTVAGALAADCVELAVRRAVSPRQAGGAASV